MKNPAASSGVSEKQELPVLMELLINTALLFNIASYRGPIPMFSNSTGKIPVRPKLSSPQLLLDLRTQSENLPRRYTFDNRYQLRHAIHRHRLHQKMYVILIHPYLQTLSDSASLFPDKRLEQPHSQLHQTRPVDISPETPCDTTIPLHYGSYECTRSRGYFTPQGAGNKSRSDLTAMTTNVNTGGRGM